MAKRVKLTASSYEYGLSINITYLETPNKKQYDVWFNNKLIDNQPKYFTFSTIGDYLQTLNSSLGYAQHFIENLNIGGIYHDNYF